MWLYHVGKALFAVIYGLLFRIRVEGTEHIPREGGVILCANHTSLHDPVVMGISAPRRITYMAKQELFDTPVLGSLIRAVGAFPVKRGQPDRAALKRSIELLQAGGCFGIFPEGTRSRTGQLGKMEPGTAYLALKSGAAVIPVGIAATYRLFGRITVRFGPPLDMTPFQAAKVSGDTVEAATSAIMAAISAQLEPRSTVTRPTGTHS